MREATPALAEGRVTVHSAGMVKVWCLLAIMVAWPPTEVLAVEPSGLTAGECLARGDPVLRELNETFSSECSGDESCECMMEKAEKSRMHEAWFAGPGQCLNEHPDNPALAELYSALTEGLAIEKEYISGWEEFMAAELGGNWSCDM